MFWVISPTENLSGCFEEVSFQVDKKGIASTSALTAAADARKATAAPATSNFSTRQEPAAQADPRSKVATAAQAAQRSQTETAQAVQRSSAAAAPSFAVSPPPGPAAAPVPPTRKKILQVESYNKIWLHLQQRKSEILRYIW